MEQLILFNLRQRPRDHQLETQTVIDQLETEQLVRKAYYEKLSTWKDKACRLFKVNHIGYLCRKLANLPTSFEALDASQPWLAYWMVHSLRLLNFSLSDETKKALIKFLRSSQHPDGGFGGGPHQFAHLATTYGSVNTLASLCEPDALDLINRPALLNWLRKLHRPDGAFVMHVGGEADVRGAYCALAVAKLTGLYASNGEELFANTDRWIAECQTYEGGFGAQPGMEAHGGYTFCGIATLCLLDATHLIDLPRVLRWVAHRQMSVEGGFQGRTNKLVDSCYSFWQGAVFPIIEELLSVSGDQALFEDEALFNASALQEYILLCCQKVSYTRPGLSVVPTDVAGLESPTTTSSVMDPVIEGGGGLIDKPGKNPDAYHTCYSLSGLSIAQHSPRPRSGSISQPMTMTTKRPSHRLGVAAPAPAVDVTGAVGEDNELADVDPLHNILHDALAFTRTYYDQLDAGASPSDAAKEAVRAADQCHLTIRRRPPPPVVVSHNYPAGQPMETVGEMDCRDGYTCTTP